MEKNYPTTQERYEDEIDLVELIKILLKNIKFIIITTILITLVGILVGYYLKSTEPITLEQNFTLSDYSQIGIDNLNPVDMFKNNSVVEAFFQEDVFSEKIEGNLTLREKRSIVSGAYNVTSIGKTMLNYKITVSGEEEKEAEELIKIFFMRLNTFIENQNKSELKEKITFVDKKINEYTKELELLESEIEEISKEYIDIVGENTTVSDVVEAMKEKRPIVFAKKETYTTLYNETLRERLEIDRAISGLTNNINIRSSIYEVEGKIRLSLIGIISILLGGFISIMIVFLKEFIKKTDWN